MPLPLYLLLYAAISFAFIRFRLSRFFATSHLLIFFFFRHFAITLHTLAYAAAEANHDCLRLSPLRLLIFDAIYRRCLPPHAYALMPIRKY